MQNGQQIKRVIDDVQAIEMLKKNIGGADSMISVVANGRSHFLPDSVLVIFRSHIITAVDKATVELFVEFERLVKESLER